jgi:hypothetical protein
MFTLDQMVAPKALALSFSSPQTMHATRSNSSTAMIGKGAPSKFVRIASPIQALDLVDEVTLATVADLEALETEVDSQAVVTFRVVSGEIVAAVMEVDSVVQVLVLLKVALPPLLQHPTPLPTLLLLVLTEVKLFTFAT